MKIVYNNILPFKGFVAVNLFGILFVKKSSKNRLSVYTINHEKIHTKQMRELLYIFYYIWYVTEWFIKLFKYKKSHESYRNISFEREAHSNDKNLEYLKNRKKYAFIDML